MRERYVGVLSVRWHRAGALSTCAKERPEGERVNYGRGPLSALGSPRSPSCSAGGWCGGRSKVVDLLLARSPSLSLYCPSCFLPFVWLLAQRFILGKVSRDRHSRSVVVGKWRRQALVLVLALALLFAKLNTILRGSNENLLCTGFRGATPYSSRSCFRGSLTFIDAELPALLW